MTVSQEKKKVYSLVLLASCNTVSRKSNVIFGMCCSVTFMVEHLRITFTYTFTLYMKEKKKKVALLLGLFCVDPAGLFLYFNQSAVTWEVISPSFLVITKNKIPDKK